MNKASYYDICDLLELHPHITTFMQLSKTLHETGFYGATQHDIQMAFGYINQFRKTKRIIFA